MWILMDISGFAIGAIFNKIIFYQTFSNYMILKNQNLNPYFSKFENSQ